LVLLSYGQISQLNNYMYIHKCHYNKEIEENEFIIESKIYLHELL